MKTKTTKINVRRVLRARDRALTRIDQEPAPMRAVPDQFVPDPVVCEEFGITPMTVHRWDHDDRMAAVGWPPKIKIRNRNYRSRQLLEKCKAAILQQALSKKAVA